MRKLMILIVGLIVFSTSMATAAFTASDRAAVAKATSIAFRAAMLHNFKYHAYLNPKYNGFIKPEEFKTVLLELFNHQDDVVAMYFNVKYYSLDYIREDYRAAAAFQFDRSYASVTDEWMGKLVKATEFKDAPQDLKDNFTMGGIPVDGGRVEYFSRDCYPGEKLGCWNNIPWISAGCGNPVKSNDRPERIDTGTPPPAKPVQEVLVVKKTIDSTTNVVTTIHRDSVAPTVYAPAQQQPQQYVPIPTMQMNGQAWIQIGFDNQQQAEYVPMNSPRGQQFCQQHQVQQRNENGHFHCYQPQRYCGGGQQYAGGGWHQGGGNGGGHQGGGSGGHTGGGNGGSTGGPAQGSNGNSNRGGDGGTNGGNGSAAPASGVGGPGRRGNIQGTSSTSNGQQQYANSGNYSNGSIGQGGARSNINYTSAYRGGNRLSQGSGITRGFSPQQSMGGRAMSTFRAPSGGGRSIGSFRTRR